MDNINNYTVGIQNNLTSQLMALNFNISSTALIKGNHVFLGMRLYRKTILIALFFNQ